MSQATFAGGWVKGDVIVAKIAHGSIAIGDRGTVEGPSANSTAADAAQRVCVDFGKGKGTMNMLATTQVEGAPLAGDWVKFDVVLSRIEHNGIEIGDQGIIMGPSNNTKAVDAEDRVNVDFGVGKGRVNMLAISQIEGVSLAGGLVKGDTVMAKIDHMKVKAGDKGKVTGPSTKASAEDASERVNVNFGTDKGCFNMQVVTQVQGIPLASGWMKGDKVLSKIKHGGVEVGDEGTVVGPSSNAAADDACERVCIAFCKERKRINMLVATQIEGAPLAGGWVKGDNVISRIRYKSVEVGQEGVVLGPSLRAFADDAVDRICVDFGDQGGCINMLAESHVKGVPLAGGWVKGDKVVSKIKHNALSIGDEGMVKGPSTNPGAQDASYRVCVYFGKEKGNINMLASSQIKGIELAGSWVKGDKIVSKIKHRDVEIGDKGTIVGPSSNPKAADADKRVCVDFGNGRGTLNMLATSQIEQPLHGGWVKGEQVLASTGFQNVAKGDSGTVVGPSTASSAQEAARQVRVDFGGAKGIINIDAFGHLARAGPEQAERPPSGNNGASRQKEQRQFKCSECGNETLPDSQFCRQCGNDLGRGEMQDDDDISKYNNSIVEGPCLGAAYRALTEQKVKELFYMSAPRSYNIQRVVLKRNDRLLRMCSDMLENLNDRRSGPLAGVFSLTLPEDIDEADRQAKAKLTTYLQRQLVTNEWAGSGSRFSGVLPAWHGAKEEVLIEIARVGFASLVDSTAADPGWFGTGRYCALESELACLYASTYPNEKPKTASGEWVVLLTAAVVGMAYPITPGRVDYPTGSLPPKDPKAFKFYGKTFRAPCDTHIVGIDGNSMLCSAPENAKYHELVSSQDAQLLPLALVYFTT